MILRDSTSWIIAGPKSFRLASREILKKKRIINGKTKDKGFGGNLQNIEKGMREIYIPDGWSKEIEAKCKYWLETFDTSIFTKEELELLRVIVQTDQSGAEAKIVAYLCENGDYRKLFINKIKPHTFLGMHLFRDIWPKKMREYEVVSSEDNTFSIDNLTSAPIDTLTTTLWWKELDRLIKDSDNWSVRYYYLSKQTEHSSNYDIQPPMFRMNILEKSGGKIMISKQDSERFLMTKHSLFPEIKDWHRRLIQQLTLTGTMFNLHGHPYTLTHPDITENQRKEYISWIPQSTVGMITNIAFARLQEYTEQEKLRWDSLINGHDSIVSQCPLDEVFECAKKQKEYIEQQFESPVDGAIFHMGSETGIGFNWAPFKKDKNEMGIREIKV